MVFLNTALALILGLLSWQLYRQSLWAHSREQRLWHAEFNPVQLAPLPLLAEVAPLVASSYAQIGQKNLFSRDRNSQVIIDPPAVIPEKPMPAFPVASGVMLWAEVPPAVILSDRPGGVQKACHAGDVIGEWKISSVDEKFVVFEREGREFRKRLDELMDKALFASSQAPNPDQAVAPIRSDAKVQTWSGPSTPSTPGIDVGGNSRLCEVGDTTPVGTIKDGMKKVINVNLFVNSCRWEPLG
jgi:type II secretory pathway component PulC